MKTRRQGLGSLAVRFAGLMFAAALVALPGRGAEAQIGSARYSAIVMEARTGTVLIDAGADEPRFPASLTKMMTVYMAFEALRDGKPMDRLVTELIMLRGSERGVAALAKHGIDYVTVDAAFRKGFDLAFLDDVADFVAGGQQRAVG